MREEGTYVELVSHTEDSKEGVAAFMERRETEFKGW
jgi:1,4-dihydroxy-2-naphthoyl-CoA synthase